MNMKTPLEKFIERITLKTKEDGVILTPFISSSDIASMLEEEKEVIVRSFMNVSDDNDKELEDVHLREFAEDYYDKTFNTKEK